MTFALQLTFLVLVISGARGYSIAQEIQSDNRIFCHRGEGAKKPCVCGRGHACPNDVWSNETLLGDWHGIKPLLGEHGIAVTSDLTQFYQGVASGGNEQIFRYGAKMNLQIQASTEQLGLWKGGELLFHAAEWQFGENSLADAVGLMPVNVNLLLPEPEASFGVTSVQYLQSLGGGWAATVGRYNLLDLWTTFYPDYGRGLEGFMNVGALIPLNAVVPGIPPVSNLAGVVKEGERGLEAAFLALESQNVPTTLGLTFPNGVTLVGALRRNTDLSGLAGSHTLLGTYATGEYTSFNTNDWVILPGSVAVPGQKRGTWFAGYFAEQRLWQDCCEKHRYTKLFGYMGFADRDTSPYEWCAAVTLEAFGLCAARSGDRMGIGYFYNTLNSPFQDLFDLVTPVDDVHGGEVYYSAAVTPWFHITLDLQAIRSEILAADTALVLGLRGKLDF